MKKVDTAKLERLMATLKISEAEALEIMAEDDEIDRGAKLYELPPELQEGARKARQMGERKAPAKAGEKKARKQDENKRFLIQLLESAVSEVSEVEVTNPEREMIFHYNGTKYKIVLSAPRT